MPFGRRGRRGKQGYRGGKSSILTHAFRLPQGVAGGKLPASQFWHLTVIDWSHIDTVLLDMDGTLLDLHYDNYFWQQHMPRRYAEIHRRDEMRA